MTGCTARQIVQALRPINAQRIKTHADDDAPADVQDGVPEHIGDIA